jgi:hypothetical protein
MKKVNIFAHFSLRLTVLVNIRFSRYRRFMFIDMFWSEKETGGSLEPPF